MATKPKLAELSEVQRQSWKIVGPFLAAQFVINLLLFLPMRSALRTQSQATARALPSRL